jgi:hypothetical protein
VATSEKKTSNCTFSGGFAVYGRTGLCIFQMALPKVNTRVFFFFFPFSAGCPGLIPEFFFLLLLFPPLIDGPTQAIAFLKIKNMMNLVKQCRGASL